MRPITEAAAGQSAGAPGDDAAVLSSFEVWPHRSLGRGGTALVIGLVALGSCLVVLRSPPTVLVPLLVGVIITVGAVALAFWCNNRAARCGELIEIGPEVVRITRFHARGTEPVVEFASYWVQVKVSDDRRVASRITLSAGGRAISIGECLSPQERCALAASLRASLERCRNRRYPDAA